MGLMRALWRITAIGWTVDNVKNIVDWFKKTIKEDCTEDNHIRKAICDSGKYDGKKAVYAEAFD